jgi:ABC-type oligopeptide transport system substrate-binding subunit
MLRYSLLALAFCLPTAAAAADPDKVFRYAIEVAETTLDPQKVSDLYSNIIGGAIFDTPLVYDYLARPLKMVPNTLASLPRSAPTASPTRCG